MSSKTALEAMLTLEAPAGLVLFKPICRHYWTLDPQATAAYVHAYREMWDGDEQSNIDEVQA